MEYGLTMIYSVVPGTDVRTIISKWRQRDPRQRDPDQFFREVCSKGIVGALFTAFVVAGFCEEAVKYWITRRGITKYIHVPFKPGKIESVLLQGAASGAGFGTFEALNYIGAAAMRDGRMKNAWVMFAFRVCEAIPVHAIWGYLSATYLCEAQLGGIVCQPTSECCWQECCGQECECGQGCYDSTYECCCASGRLVARQNPACCCYRDCFTGTCTNFMLTAIWRSVLLHGADDAFLMAGPWIVLCLNDDKNDVPQLRSDLEDFGYMAYAWTCIMFALSCYLAIERTRELQALGRTIQDSNAVVTAGHNNHGNSLTGPVVMSQPTSIAIQPSQTITVGARVIITGPYYTGERGKVEKIIKRGVNGIEKYGIELDNGSKVAIKDTDFSLDTI